MAQARWFSMAADRDRNEDLPAGTPGDETIGRVSDEDEDEFDETEDLDEEDEDLEEEQ